MRTQSYTYRYKRLHTPAEQIIKEHAQALSWAAVSAKFFAPPARASQKKILYSRNN